MGRNTEAQPIDTADFQGRESMPNTGKREMINNLSHYPSEQRPGNNHAGKPRGLIADVPEHQ